jgi:hypothetical protein
MERHAWFNRLKFRSGRQTKSVNPPPESRNRSFRFDEMEVKWMVNTYFKDPKVSEMGTKILKVVVFDLDKKLSTLDEFDGQAGVGADRETALLMPFINRTPLTLTEKQNTNDYRIRFPH